MYEEFLTGDKLYGDDFTNDEIRVWFEHEAEAYANLSKNRPVEDVNTSNYGYHILNNLHGYRHIKLKENSVALGIGAAYGAEFIPIANKLKEIHILEPSDQLISKKLGDIPLHYEKPDISGKLIYPNDHFDIITCFGTLHHIPNVSYVISEMARVLKPGGYILIREPIISMGDWSTDRKGLTKYERGIPLPIFRKLIKQFGLITVKESPCFTMIFFFQKLFKKNLYDKKWYMIFDAFLSKMLLFNYTYHARNKLQRLAPSNVFYVLKK